MIDRLDKELRTWGRLAVPYRCHTIRRLTASDLPIEFDRRRPTRSVFEKVRLHLSIEGDDFMHRLRMGDGLLPCRCGSHQSLHIDFVGIEQKADERHLIVRLVSDVADNESARMAGKVVEMLRRRLLSIPNVREWEKTRRKACNNSEP